MYTDTEETEGVLLVRLNISNLNTLLPVHSLGYALALFWNFGHLMPIRPNRFSVPHDRLFLDALERDLKREKMGQEPTTVVTGLFPVRIFLPVLNYYE